MSTPKILVLSTFAFSLITCSPTETPQDSPKHADHIVGLASPVKMQADSTSINLLDYFPDIAGIDHVVWEGDTLEILESTSSVWLHGNSPSAISVLEVSYQNTAHHIPVFTSEKVRYELSVDLDGNPSTVAIAGNINGWNPSATPLTNEENGSWSTSLLLNPGLYQYQVVVDGEWMLDPNNPNKMDNGQGGFNSTFVAGNPDAPAPVLSADLTGTNEISMQLSSEQNILVWHEDQFIGSTSAGKINLVYPLVGFEGRTWLRAWGYDENGRSNDLLIPMQDGVPVVDPNQLTRHDHETMIMYFLMVDRFKNGNPENDFPVDDPDILPVANNYGGDFTGINQKIADGYFESLGMNTIWISPITQNPEGAWGLWNKGVTSKFSGYHGYWPVTSTTIDYRFGTEASFKELIDLAHADEMNLLVDYVANHVHEEHSVYQQHPDWATDLYLPDGTMNTEKWDEHRLTTWFDTFLPTLDFSKPEVVEAMTDSALFWFTNYPIDGFRHDATKHIPEDFWRTLTRKIKEDVVRPEGRAVFQIGETYGNPELIGSYVSSGQLDAQFDFNLYDAAVDAFAKDESTFENLARVLNESLKYYGSHHKMGMITGNQDRTRFISYADGSVAFDEDPKLAGWTREITHNGEEGFEKLQLLHAFVMSAPGIPCIYYGDEIGLPGANDPDNRRMMRFDGWNDAESSTFDGLAALSKLRSSRMSMLYGNTEVKQMSEDVFVLERTYLGESTWTVICKDPKGCEIGLELEETPEVLTSGGMFEELGDKLVFSGRGYVLLGHSSK